MYDVIFVDDDGALAQSWSDLISRRLSLVTLATDSPSRAYDTVATEGAKIVVLDQRMPEESGTSVGKRIRALDPSVFLVLMSGAAEYEDAAEAHDTGFVSIVHKNSALAKLPSLLEQLILEYELRIDEQFKAVNVVLKRKRGLFHRKFTSLYRFLSIDKIDDTYIFPDSWRTRARIDAGTTQMEKIKVQWSEGSEVEVENSSKNAANFGLGKEDKLKLTVALQSEVSKRVKSKVTVNSATEIEVQRTLALTAEPSDPDQLHVKARAYQIAPVYARVSARVASTCSCCGVSSVIKMITYIPVKKYATRQVDYLSNNSEKVVDTGIQDIV